MRPVHLVLENFGSFRGRHTVAFDGVDLFVLAGPTGAGKSTVLDAITMALYGSVPRYENANMIEPAISRLATQAAVSFTFALAEDRYVVTRLLRRTPSGGATAAEVRLERVRPDGTTTPLASGSREVTPAVVHLLGLNFDEFCKTVVLPQGAFAKFLHGGRTERQDLLVRLLGLEQYAEIGQAARSREAALGTKLGLVASQLADLAEVDETSVQAARERAERLGAARDRVVQELWPELDRRRQEYASAEQRQGAILEQLQALEGLEAPDGVEELAARVRRADERLTSAERDLEAANRRMEQERERLERLPDPSPRSELLRLDDELAIALREVDGRDVEAREAGVGADAAAEASREAEERVEAAREELDRLRRRHVAHTLSEGLEEGDDCPVCRRPIEAPPAHPAPPGLRDAEERANQAVKVFTGAQDALRRSEAAATAARTRLVEARGRVDRLGAELHALARAAEVVLVEGRPDRRGLESEVAAHEQAVTTVRKCDEDAMLARRAHATARQTRIDLEADAGAAWRAFDRARDLVSRLGAPAPSERTDVAAAWERLLQWRDGALDRVRRELEDAVTARRSAEEAGHEQADLIRRVVLEAGVELPPGGRSEEVLSHLSGAASTAGTHAEQLAEKLVRATALRGEQQQLESERQVAELLGQLLRRDQFEQWLLNRLSTQLVSGASIILNDLTQGAFSLSLDAERGSFEVVDHLNADERRSAKTLSGGETFLASLALALALAEHVTQVNAAGASRLDALFLDEGFGSLDPETLETVAAAIEDLSGSRVVGVITHVRELAARIPYRFDVWRGPDGSVITPAPPDDAAALADLMPSAETPR